MREGSAAPNNELREAEYELPSSATAVRGPKREEEDVR